MFFGVLKEMLSKCSGGLHGWVILNDHYHILVKLKDVFILPDLIRKVHSKSAVILNKEHVRPGRKVWYQYWDECVRNERDFYVKLNYIHLNPIKHGYVDDIASYRFSSYRHYLQLEGATWLNDVLEQFPPSSTIKGDDF
jgi:putative transposase